MRRPTRMAAGGALLVVVLYLLLWPVPVDPAAWEAPPDPGRTGPFAENQRLAGAEAVALGAHEGPEDVAIDAEGRVYLATHDGTIVRLQPDGSAPEDWARTGGRPLGIDFDAAGRLIVADAVRGLLAITRDGTVAVLTDSVDGERLRYVDDVDVAADGTIYFSDASRKFGAKENGGTLAASKLDILEHRGHGRLLAHDPVAGVTRTVVDGLCFANGVAIDPAQRFVLVAETASYRVLRHWLTGPQAGTTDVLIDQLPGFPDNVTVGRDGRFWIGIVAPRSRPIDLLAGWPFLRRVIQRLPAMVQPAPVPYGHVVAADDRGAIVADLQDPAGTYPMTTSVIETDTHLWLGSLTAPHVARIDRATAGLR